MPDLAYGARCKIQLPGRDTLTEALYKGKSAGAHVFEDVATLHIIRIPLDLELVLPETPVEVKPETAAKDVAQSLPNIPGHNHPKTIAVDFDGTLVTYNPKEYPKIGEPIPGMIEMLQRLKAEDWNILIFTCRSADDVKAWLDEHQVPYAGINDDPGNPRQKSGKVMADIYLDDKAVRFTGDAQKAYADIQAAMAQ